MADAFAALIEDGWNRHEAATAEVADALERQAALADDAPKCAQYAMLVAHAIGQHQRDWARAARLICAATAKLPSDPALAGALAQLAVAQLLSGDTYAALATELRAAMLAPAEAAGRMLRLRLLAADALIGSDRRAEALALMRACFDAAERSDFEGPTARVVAVSCNNLASTQLELKSRSAEEDELMVCGASLARRYWLKVGDWKNHERADHLVAMVANALARHDEARTTAERGLALIAANGAAPVDEAFLRLDLAVALRGLGDAAASAREIAAADRLAKDFEPDIAKWFAGERAKLA
jgi:hypothetical protein